MKKARFILTALILLAGVGGALAFKVSRFTANPVQFTTDLLTTRVGTLTYAAFAGIAGVPVLLCKPDYRVYWSPNGITLDAFSTLLLTTTIPFTTFAATTTPTTTITTTATIICGQLITITTTTTTATTTKTVLTVTKSVHTCTETVGLVTFAI